ncbi:hypothetical protein GHT09_006036 [Marmota monax]|uniref:CRAL/TRIO N-terminal domain-containing protein n=1 Tax=Marmota monax TaxID=9995 RepID=A0A834UMK9_MARMO|nr:hypothetical protein GHT09_006036 [Marmota monax]
MPWLRRFSTLVRGQLPSAISLRSNPSCTPLSTASAVHPPPPSPAPAQPAPPYTIGTPISTIAAVIISTITGLVTTVNTTVSSHLDKAPDDAFILRFLRARKFHQADAFRLLAQYFQYRQLNLDMFKNFKADDPGIKRALIDGFPGVLENRDHYGRKILLLFAANWDQSR